MRTPDSAAVLARFEGALDLVDIVATDVARVVSSLLDYDELLSFGREGLLAAARRFDPERGVPFRTYAGYRVRGAILDGVRRSGPIPRKTYDLLLGMARASSASEGNIEEVFPAQPGQPGLDDDDAEHELRPHLADIATAATVGLVAQRLRCELAARAADAASPSPEDALIHAELLELVKSGVRQLQPEESELIRRHYFEDETLEEIAARLEISGSWASRLHTRAVASLTKRLRRSA